MTATSKVVVEEDFSYAEGGSLSSEGNESINEEGTDSETGDLANESDNEEVNNTGKVNAGWADAVAKILKTNKPKGKKTLVLSKAKKLTDVSKKKSKDVGFEIESKEGQIKREIESESSSDESDQEKRPIKKRRKELPSVRIKPDILQKDREKKLCKIATKGVVQLFNAVRNQQSEIKTKLQEVGPLELKKDKVLKSIDKRTFLDVLMGKTTSEPVDTVQQPETKSESKKENNVQKPTWDVLKDDFMMSARMKDWDKEREEEIESERELEIESS